MVFQVKDPAMLDQVKAGDKIRFQADKIGGPYSVTKIEVPSESARPLLLAATATAFAQSPVPYAGQESRPVKALRRTRWRTTSPVPAWARESRRAQPLPRADDTLELADTLGPSADQRTGMASLMKRHKAEARELGAEVVRLERGSTRCSRSRRRRRSWSTPRSPRSARRRRATGARTSGPHRGDEAPHAGPGRAVRALRGYAGAVPRGFGRCHGHKHSGIGAARRSAGASTSTTQRR